MKAKHPDQIRTLAHEPEKIILGGHEEDKPIVLTSDSPVHKKGALLPRSLAGKKSKDLPNN